jgi:hypothetical protein
LERVPLFQRLAGVRQHRSRTVNFFFTSIGLPLPRV